MTKQKIIAAITRLAHDATIAPAERQKQLEAFASCASISTSIRR